MLWIGDWDTIEDRTKSLLSWRAVTHIPVRERDNKPMSSSVLSGGVSSNKTNRLTECQMLCLCVYICAVLPRVKGSLSGEVTCEQRPEGSELCGHLGEECSRQNAKTLRPEVRVRN